jgi:methyl-accepting chemotaxis protein
MEAVAELCRRIGDLGSTMEEHFLSIGSKVQEYSDSASRITSMTMAASEIMSGDEISGAIEGLEEMVNQLEEIFHRANSVSNKNLETLKSIGWSVRSVEKDLSGLGDTSRDLKMLALSTKIQSTKTGSGSSAFMQLGQDIAMMSVTISSKAADLFSETTTLSDFVNDVQATLHDLKDKQKYQTENVLKGTRSIIESMADLSTKSISEAERIRQSSQEISLSVSEMVTAVQYQDITRQSLDKVVEALNGIWSDQHRFVSFDGSTDSPMARVSPEILMTGQCLRQVRRLERTDTLMEEALEKTVLSLEGITDNIERMAGVTSAANRDSKKFLNDLESAMSSVTSFLKEVVQSSREMSDSMNSLAHTVEGMSEFTEDIELISEEVELISINARIMAAQTGVDGAGMGVIAAAVQDTAGHSEDQRRSVVGKLNEISMASVDLKGEIENVARSEEVKLDQLVRELGVFLDALRIMQERIVSMLFDIDNQNSELKHAINSSIDEIRDHIRLDRNSVDIARDMKALALNCSGSIKPADLVLINNDSLTEEDLQGMGHQVRVELVEEFFNEHFFDEYLEEPHNGSSEEGDVVLFDSDY